MKRAEGMTLIELMIVMAILSAVLGLLFLLSESLQRSVAAQEAKVSTQDNVRTGMQTVMRELRQAARGSFNWTALPGDSLSYQRAEDLDGNGTAVDSGVFLELGPQRTLQRDINDANGDGETIRQLVIVDANTVQVVANGLLPNEDINADGTLGAGEDRNFNGVLDRGLWFEPVGEGIRVTLQAQRSLGPRSPLMTSQLVEIVVPRN